MDAYFNSLEEGLNTAIEIAKDFGVKRAIKLPVSGAFHSELMRPARKVMEDALKRVNIKEPKIPLLANVTANQVFLPNEIKESLVNQITERVRWTETVQHLEDEGIKEIIEIGAGR